MFPLDFMIFDKTILNNVDLPAPFGPIKPKLTFSPIENVTFLRA